MSIAQHPEQAPFAAAPALGWGELTAVGETARILRFVLVDRVITFRASEVSRWEHIQGDEEVLVIEIGRENVVIEGVQLGLIRAAIDSERLSEVRTSSQRRGARLGTWVRSISLEKA